MTPRWNICHQLLYCSVGAGSARPNIVPQFLTLLLWFVFHFMSFSHCTFYADRKYQRTRHRVKIVAMFFAQELLCNIHRSNIACRSSLFVSVQALRDSCGYSVIKENITLPHFKHFLAYSWTETGFHSIFNSAVILEITYACGKPRTKGNIKKKSGTVWATARVSSNWGIRTKVSERVCYTMPGVREASSFVPEIGTADTNDK